jgi:cation transport ATPase
MASNRPEDKVEVVRRLAADDDLRPVIMVADGINDVRAFEIADCVAAAVYIGRPSLHIARQSVLAGTGLSLAAVGRRLLASRRWRTGPRGH